MRPSANGEGVPHRRDWNVELDLSSGETLQTECVLVAAGRQSSIERAAPRERRGRAGQARLVTVNEQFQTSAPHIYAAGDVIGHPALASTSMEQARVAMCHAFDLKYKTHVGPLLPYGIYTIPECSYVGATEEELKKKGVPYEAGGLRVARQRPREDHRRDRLRQAARVARDDRQAAGRAHRRRARQRARSRRAGPHDVRRDGGRVHRAGLQLSDARRGVQVRGLQRARQAGTGAAKSRPRVAMGPRRWRRAGFRCSSWRIRRPS